MPRKSDPVARSQRRWGAGLVLLGATMTLIVYSVAYLFATYQGLDYTCAVSGPHSSLAVVTEESVATGHFGHWPLGRECEWPRADGTGAVVARSDDWTGTLALGSSLLIAFGGLVLSVVGRIPRHERGA